ncbi:MAG: type II toxin-antitoxin system RatA family toxin [Sphingomonadales bacterium]
MPTHAEKRTIPYSCEQLFALVADVSKYPEFLPWCVGSRITRRVENTVYADLIIGFKVFRERFSSRVTLHHPNRIDVAYLKGPLKYLNNHWLFIDNGDGSCTIDFYVDFEFHSHLFQKLVGPLFNEAVRRMVAAFDARAHELYGPPGVISPGE